VGAGGEKVSLASRRLPPALAEGGLLWLATILAVAGLSGRRQAVNSLCLGLLSLVPVAANRRIAQTFREAEVFAPTAFARALDRRDPPRRFKVLAESAYFTASRDDELCRDSDPSFNAWSRATWLLHTHAFWRRGTVFNWDFDKGDLSRVESLRTVARQLVLAGDPTPLFASLSLRFGIRFRDQDPLPGYRPFGGDSLQAWDECASALPPVRLLDRWQETGGSLDSLEGLMKDASAGPFLDTGRRQLGRSSGGRVLFLEDSPERLRADIETSEAGWLFVLRAFWSQRDVLLDGHRAEVVPAQLAFSAVSIPPGSHHLEWTERVPGWEISRWGPALFFLLILGIALSERARASGRRVIPV
jgi:hypothetical protein